MSGQMFVSILSCKIRANANGWDGRARRTPIRLFVGKSECLSENVRTLDKSHRNDWLMKIFLAFHILLPVILLLIDYFMLHCLKKAKVGPCGKI